MRETTINGLKKPILLSVLVHLILALCFARIAWNVASSRPENFITLESPFNFLEQTPEPEKPNLVKQPTIRQAPVQPEMVRLPQVAKPAEQKEGAIDSSRTDSTKEFSRQQFFAASPFIAYKMPLDSPAVDSTDSGKVLTPTMSLGPFHPPMLKSTPGPYDPVQRAIDKQNRDGAQTLPLGQALNQGARYLSSLLNKKKAEKPVRFDTVPSEAEIEVFKALWKKPRARDLDIYASMDSSVKLTAVDLNRVLTRLTEKGMLTRKIVSPQNEFTFPIGTVEMSAKNRRNRVYEYETRVRPQELLIFLQAVLYEREHGNNTAGKRNEQALSSLRDKILQVASLTAKD